MKLEPLIKKLTEEYEIAEGSLSSEVPGVYSIPLEGDLSVVISEMPEGFTLTSEVVSCPGEKEEEFLTQAMLANLFGQGTQECVLGLNESGKMLTLARNIEDNTIEYKEFMDIIEDFINSVDFWRAEVAEHLGQKSPE